MQPELDENNMYGHNVIYNWRILLAFTSPVNNKETILFGRDKKSSAKIEANQRITNSNEIRFNHLAKLKITHHLFRATDHLLHQDLPTMQTKINLPSPAVIQLRPLLSY